jgi:hypothetical protein
MTPTLNLIAIPLKYKVLGSVNEDLLQKALTNNEIDKEQIILWAHQALMVDLLNRIPTCLTQEETGSQTTRLAHLRWMLSKGSTTPMASDKAARWLGYVQGVCDAKGWIDVSQERDRTRTLLHMYSRLSGDAIPQSLAP